jgi:hypothetical protein
LRTTTTIKLTKNYLQKYQGDKEHTQLGHRVTSKCSQGALRIRKQKGISTKKILITLIGCLILVQCFGQTQKDVSTYLLTEYSKTIYDRTTGNNPWGVGLALQTFFNNKTKFKPTIELTGNIYLADDKVFRTDANGTEIAGVEGMVNLFFGASFNPTQIIYFSFSAGPSFVTGQTLFGIKPSVGFYFSASQKWTGKISYINIFNRDKATGQDFGSLSLAIGLKLF